MVTTVDEEAAECDPITISDCRYGSHALVNMDTDCIE